MKPNIFDIATKELSQDGFITWLLQFADDKYKSADAKLNACGKAFITQLIKKQFPNFSEPINTVEVERQWKRIDIWATVNNKYSIIIEDKIDTSQHSNQLERYKKIAEKWCAENSYEKPVCVYLKTGNENQRSLEDVEEQGFSIFSRIDFIKLLEQFKDITNNIFIDFYERLTRIEKANNEFENKLIKDWQGTDWQGFFQFLEREIEFVKWDYVNNPNGGFWCAHYSWEEWGNYAVYIQLEQGKLCFKISTNPDDDIEMPEGTTRGEIRNEFHDLIMNKASKLGFEHITRPKRLGDGNYMTVAIVEQENWLGNSDEKINKEKIIETLKSYSKFLVKAIK